MKGPAAGKAAVWRKSLASFVSKRHSLRGHEILSARGRNNRLASSSSRRKPVRVAGSIRFPRRRWICRRCRGRRRQFNFLSFDNAADQRTFNFDANSNHEFGSGKIFELGV